MSNKELNVKCPVCKESFSYYTVETRPFCSSRCQSIDMGNWFNETYAVPGKSGSVYIEDDTFLKDSDDDDL